MRTLGLGLIASLVGIFVAIPSAYLTMAIRDSIVWGAKTPNVREREWDYAVLLYGLGGAFAGFVLGTALCALLFIKLNKRNESSY